MCASERLDSRCFRLEILYTSDLAVNLAEGTCCRHSAIRTEAVSPYVFMQATGSKAGGVSFAIHYWLGKSISKVRTTTVRLHVSEVHARI